MSNNKDMNNLFNNIDKDVDGFLQKKAKPMLTSKISIAQKKPVFVAPQTAVKAPEKPTKKPRRSRRPNKPREEPKRNFILAEAAGLVHGDRAKTYSTPKIDWTCAAAMMTAAMNKKYPNSKITFEAEDVGVLQICLKISRQMNGHKHDNLVDIAGYAECIAWLREENEEDANGEV